VNERGRKKRMTKLEVATRQLINKAVAGDGKALKLLIDLHLGLREVTRTRSSIDGILTRSFRKISASADW